MATETKILGPSDEQTTIRFFETCTDLKHTALSKFNGVYEFHEVEEDTIVLLSYQVNKTFCCTKGL